MKILVFSDFHITGRNPSNRIDNYYQSCLVKFDEILSLSKDCNYIVSCGDMLDTHLVANSIIDDLLDRIETNKVPLLCVFGNHELVSYNKEASNSTSLAHMIRRSKIVQLLDELELDNVWLKAYHSYFGIEEDIKKEGLKSHQNKKSIIFTHAFITPKPFFSNVSQVLIKDVKTESELVWCSHLHEQFDIKHNNTRFVNLSSVGRISVNEQHMPQVAIVDTNTLDVQFITLKSAKKPEEAFDLSRYEELKMKSKGIEEFLSSLQGTEWITLDLVGQVEKLAKEGKIEKDVKDYLIKKIGESIA